MILTLFMRLLFDNFGEVLTRFDEVSESKRPNLFVLIAIKQFNVMSHYLSLIFDGSLK